MTGGGDEDDDDSNQSPGWRILVDENLHPNIAAELESLDFQAEHLLDALSGGTDDFEEILPYCRKHDAILVTNNVRDFNFTNLSRDDHAGIIIVHDKNRPPEEIAFEVHRIAEAYPSRDAFLGFESADDWG